jgi:hypothetical protein
MTLIYILYPAFLLSAACTGYGLAAMMLFPGRFAELPIAFRFIAAYFLGQSLLVGLFVSLALFGVFTSSFVVWLVVPGAILCALSLWLYRHGIHSACIEAIRSLARAPLSWRLLTVLAALLFAYGFSTMGRVLEGDGSAFYLAAAKLMAHTGRIGSLPGYESFSWVIMTGELLYGSLMLLGSPGTSARVYEWINFLPLLGALYSVARICGLSARAAFLATLMALTSSAAVGLWGGGKTDTFAVGPALIAVWFALASWRSDRRRNYIAMSGLFCGFAIATKFSYLIVLLPCTMLLIHWHDTLAALGEMKAFAWRGLLQRVIRIALNSLWFFGLLAIGLAPFVVKNLIIFNAPFGSAGTLASSAYFSSKTTLRLILSYPIALTYGRYWAQLGTLSPLILAFIPLFFLMPRSERRLASPLMAMTISTVVALAIWMILMPSIFMPRYILATLLLLGIPAAAGAAHVSRERTILAGMVVSATAVVTMLTPNQVMSRTLVFEPGWAIDYFRDGDEEALFTRDAYVAPSMEINKSAPLNDRVLLLVYQRVWLRGDLLERTSTTDEVAEAKELLDKRGADFWAYLQDKGFRSLIVDAAQLDSIAAAVKVKPSELVFCQVTSPGAVAAFQIGETCNVCPSGNRTYLRGPFPKIWPDGNAYRADLASERTGDSPDFLTKSRLAFCEDETRLLTPHSSHSEIRTAGSGRFSHWGKELYFSASDNSDPNTNGKSYYVVQPR